MIYLDSPEQDQDSASLYQASYYRKLSGVSKIIEAIFLRERKNTAANSPVPQPTSSSVPGFLMKFPAVFFLSRRNIASIIFETPLSFL